MAEVVVAVKSVDRGSQNIQSLGDKLGKLGMSALGINSAMQVASAAMNAFTGTVQGAWRALGEGAALTTAQGNFERLAGSIGTTADALRNDLTAATQGMVSQAQLMASASELMALGLTRTHDQTVRLGSVAGQLGWNMQHLILELNNMSGLRLDALGLELDKVKAKAKEFEAAGMSAKEAYAEAVITMGEQKLDIIQLSDAEKAMRQLTTAAEDAGNAFKIAFAQGLSDNMQDVADGAMAMGDSWKYAAEWAGQYAAITSGFVLRGVTASGMRMEMDNLREAFLAAGGSMAEFEERYKGLFDNSNRWSVEQLSLIIQQLEADIVALKDAAAYANPELRQLTQWGAIPNANIRSVAEWTDEAKKAAIAAAELADEWAVGVRNQDALWAEAGRAINERYTSAVSDAMKAQYDAAQKLGEIFQGIAQTASSAFTEAMGGLKDAKMPDLFGLDGSADIDAMNQRIMTMAGASGAAAGGLADIGVALGQFTPEMAEAAMKTALFTTAMDSLIKDWTLGRIDTSQFMASYDEVIQLLQDNTLEDLLDKVANPTKTVQIEPVEIPVLYQMPEGVTAADLAGPSGDYTIEVPIAPTIGEDALRLALDALDGVPDDARTITLLADPKAVTDSLDVITQHIAALDSEIKLTANTSAVDTALELYNGTRATVVVDFVAGNSPDIPHRAGGGPVGPNSPYWVGEAGPELFVPSSAGTIIPNGRAMSGGGGWTVNMNVNFNGTVSDPTQVARSLRDGLDEFYADIRRQGVAL